MKLKKHFFAIIAVLLLALPGALASSPIEGCDQNCEFNANGELSCSCPLPSLQPEIDVVFVIDSTGSMADEIRSVKTHIKNIVYDVRRGNPKPDLRIGVVSFRDHPLEDHTYVTRQFGLDGNVHEALEFIENIRAEGGGDYPEAVTDGLDVGINKMDWKRSVSKLIFLIGDAAPHGYQAGDSHYHQGVPTGITIKDNIYDARKKDVKIFTISGSGMESVGVRIWKELARETGGSYKALNYVRQDVDQYYAEEGIDTAYLAEAKSSADYDASSNSILTNTLGKITKTAIMSEATALGVDYEEKPSDEFDREVEEATKGDHGEDRSESADRNGLYDYFKQIFLSLWD